MTVLVPPFIWQCKGTKIWYNFQIIFEKKHLKNHFFKTAYFDTLKSYKVVIWSLVIKVIKLFGFGGNFAHINILIIINIFI